jgi:hypothetical protein
VAVWLAHDAVFAVEHGIGAGFAQAMRTGGHDAYWPAFSILAAVVTTILSLRAAVRIGRLGRQAGPWTGRHRPTGGAADRAPGYLRELVRLWLSLFVVVATAFAIQENVEHVAGHGHVLGLGALIGPEYPLALPVIGLVTLAAAALGAIVRWRIGVLEARLANRQPAARPVGAAARRPASRWADVAALRVRTWFLVRLDAGRAPPAFA